MAGGYSAASAAIYVSPTLDPYEGQVVANWNTGVATSGAAGADLITIGAADTNRKIHDLKISIALLTVGATITVRMYTLINGTERQIYPPVGTTFVVGTDPDGVWIINGTLGIHEALRVELMSNNALDDGLGVDYDYLLETTS